MLRGAAGVVGGGAIAVAASRLNLQDAAAQNATPAAGAYPTSTYIAKEYSFDGPTSLSGGLNQITLQNTGTMDHHAMFMLLNDGKTAADLGAAAAKDGLGGLFRVATSLGGPASVSAGYSSTVVLDLKAGNYVIICVIPDDDGIPHMAKGMALPITVSEAPATPLAAPNADLTIELADFMFTDLPATVKAGKQVWEIKNVASQLHELAIYQLAEGFTWDQFMAMLTSSGGSATPMPGMDMGTPSDASIPATPEAAGAPPAVDIGGIAPVSPGYGGWALLDLKAGNYGAICFVPDVKTGAPHFALGMTMAFTAE